MKELSPEAKKIREHGWKRGSLIKLENTIDSHGQRGVIEPGWYLLISQDCDIQTPTLIAEPHTEIILCTQIEKPDRALTRGKHPRKLHFPLHKGKEKIYFECEIKNRFFLDRGILTKTQPRTEFLIKKEIIDDFVLWLIRKYDRDAFPDNFNAHLDRDAIAKTIKKAHDCIKAVCVRLHSEEELSAEQPYQIQLILLVDDDITEETYQTLISNLLTKLIEKIEKNGGIQVIDGNVLRSKEISLSEFSELKQLGLDYLSSHDDN